MPTMTLSIPPELYRKMKKHPEIKWSEVARKAIAEYLSELENSRTEMSMLEFRELLGDELIRDIESVPDEAYEEYYKKARDLEWERTKRNSTTRTS
ncbi:hypothetical protein APY94_01980 [Thermococcus celericrescens]|uniref:Uncharacterized protein n=1 Tax=Thermococcus celericrescens TaxID=227598 RepID=A0A117IU17_9EURY|nr:hypothetical protein [Thermococcus celericrescens]KUH34425.1 hypothetical protein APY94_01980 [Thermococcus celericrescens]